MVFGWTGWLWRDEAGRANPVGWTYLHYSKPAETDSRQEHLCPLSKEIQRADHRSCEESRVARGFQALHDGAVRSLVVRPTSTVGRLSRNASEPGPIGRQGHTRRGADATLLAAERCLKAAPGHDSSLAPPRRIGLLPASAATSQRDQRTRRRRSGDCADCRSSLRGCRGPRGPGGDSGPSWASRPDTRRHR